jgi:hypothetical protein
MKNISRIVFGCLLVCALTPAPAVFTQELKTRKLVKFRETDEPVEIVKVTIDRREIPVNAAFDADDEWVKGLSFTVRNVSQKPIHYLSLEIGIPVTGTEADDIGITLTNGGRRDVPGDHKKEPVNIQPGQAYELGFDVSQFAGLKKHVEKLGGSLDTQNVRVNVGLVVFDDDTGWGSGQPMRRDPDNPGDWYVTVNPDGTTREDPPKRPRSPLTKKIGTRARQEESGGCYFPTGDVFYSCLGIVCKNAACSAAAKHSDRLNRGQYSKVQRLVTCKSITCGDCGAYQMVTTLALTGACERPIASNERTRPAATGGRVRRARGAR